jgi:hypothetical protein
LFRREFIPNSSLYVLIGWLGKWIDRRRERKRWIKIIHSLAVGPIEAFLNDPELSRPFGTGTLVLDEPG